MSHHSEPWAAAAVASRVDQLRSLPVQELVVLPRHMDEELIGPAGASLTVSHEQSRSVHLIVVQAWQQRLVSSMVVERAGFAVEGDGQVRDLSDEEWLSFD